jgi:EAL domain-containing protein (putative c-di-GMP-specific phosphodiesterase class I)/class 3 adenylate cyclase
MDTHVQRRIQIERELRSAIKADILVPHYQPLVSLKSDRIIGFEALARWENRTLGPIPPEVFIPIAEETGLINVLGDQLFRRACLDANAWPGDFTLAFNVSPIQLRDPALGLRILSILGQTGFSPRRLEIEITESALVENVGVAQTVIDELRQAGVRVALDDFGTGYATLSQLLSFHLDKIKIDRGFVSRLDRSENGQVIVRAILGLAKGFGLTTTAEGVENAGQLAYLKANGCTEGQGYPDGEHLYFTGNVETLHGDIEEFVTGHRESHSVDLERILATVLFTDIVDSTRSAAEMGDQAWRRLLDSHDQLAKQMIAKHRGIFVKSTGDGILATFDGPGRGVRCALAFGTASKQIGLPLRAGLHTGEIEMRGRDIGGIAVHAAARVMAKSQSSEVLVSRVVTDLVAGAGLTFSGRGSHDLKGLPGRWDLFVASA